MITTMRKESFSIREESFLVMALDTQVSEGRNGLFTDG
jgi:hypothetical protein